MLLNIFYLILCVRTDKSRAKISFSQLKKFNTYKVAFKIELALNISYSKSYWWRNKFRTESYIYVPSSLLYRQFFLFSIFKIRNLYTCICFAYDHPGPSWIANNKLRGFCVVHCYFCDGLVCWTNANKRHRNLPQEK